MSSASLLIINVGQIREFIITPSSGLYINLLTHEWSTTQRSAYGTLLRWDGAQLITFDGQRCCIHKPLSLKVYGDTIIAIPLALSAKIDCIFSGALQGSIALGQCLYAYRNAEIGSKQEFFTLQKNRTFESEIKITYTDDIVTFTSLLQDIHCQQINVGTWNILSQQGCATIVVNYQEGNQKSTSTKLIGDLLPSPHPRLQVITKSF